MFFPNQRNKIRINKISLDNNKNIKNKSKFIYRGT